MNFRTIAFAAGALLATASAPALAQDVTIYPFPSSENYCPADLQPVTISGVICCGTPNTATTYHAVMRHPVVRKRHHVRKTYSARPGRVACPVGEKGCHLN